MRVLKRAGVIALAIMALTACDTNEAESTWDIDTLTDAPACVTEDQVTDCFWDATKHGNGTGRSFAVDNGEVIYLDELGLKG